MNALLERRDTVVPTNEDAELAATASRAMARTKRHELHVRIDDTELPLPSAVKDLLFRLLTEMAQGHAVTLIPIHAELTTQEAADYLNVSRPHLVKLLEEKKLPFHKVGTHRRVRFTDLAAYKAKFETQRRKVMERLAKEAQDMGMGYPNV
jgi:excisionase family DNA binding protein